MIMPSDITAPEEVASAVNYRGRRISRPSGLERRQQIIDATLRIIVREGMRGVRHRAVAAEAKVPLAATTYYFRDIEDLITAAFLDWATRNNGYPERFRQACFECVDTTLDSGVDASIEARRHLVDSIVKLATDYIIDQVGVHHEHRIIELAFQHEAYGNDKLKSVVLRQHESTLNDLEAFHQMIHSPNPQADAQITYGLILRIEQDLFMRGVSAASRQQVAAIFYRHMESLMNLARAN
jgi:TetR/AcrR family transcriptional regulator, regulator of biofilm formation and stress response